MPVDEDRKQRLAKLLERARDGDEAALNALCQELSGTIRGYLWNTFRNSDLVDDLTQETYLRLLKNFKNVREPMYLRSFVAKVAVHVSQDYFRKKYRDREEGLGEEALDRLPTLASASEAEPVAARIDLHKALSKLPDKARRVLLMKADGYKYEEISEEMGLSVSGVKMQVKRNMEILRNALGGVTFLALAATLTITVLSEWRGLTGAM